MSRAEQNIILVFGLNVLSYWIAEAHLIVASLCPKVLADSKKKDLLAGLNALVLPEDQ